MSERRNLQTVRQRRKDEADLLIETALKADGITSQILLVPAAAIGAKIRNFFIDEKIIHARKSLPIDCLDLQSDQPRVVLSDRLPGRSVDQGAANKHAMCELKREGASGAVDCRSEGAKFWLQVC